MRFALICLLFLMPFLSASMPAAQVPDPQTLKTLAEQQKEAEQQAKALKAKQEKVNKEIGSLRSDLVKTTAQARGFEKAYNAAQDQLKRLRADEAALTIKLAKDRAVHAQLLAALQRLDYNPPPIILMSTQSTLETSRSAHLMSAISKDLQTRSNQLAESLAAFEDVREQIKAIRGAAQRNAKEIDKKLKTIETIITKKAELNSSLDKDRQKKIQEAQKLADEAKSLRDLISKFEDAANDIAPRLKPAKPEPGTPSPQKKPPKDRPSPVYVPKGDGRFTDSRGKLPLPVLGTLSKKFGSTLSSGAKSKGIQLTTGRRAQVVAPFPARVEFAGLFNDDNVVILNVGNGYFIVMTGLGRTFTKAGDQIDAGEPLGLMPGNQNPVLFMEFRKNRTSVNPMPWIGPALAKAR